MGSPARQTALDPREAALKIRPQKQEAFQYAEGVKPEGEFGLPVMEMTR